MFHTLDSLSEGTDATNQTESVIIQDKEKHQKLLSNVKKEESLWKKYDKKIHYLGGMYENLMTD